MCRAIHSYLKEVFLISKLLCPRSLLETAVIRLFHIKRHLLSESGFTETQIACEWFLSGQKGTEIARPAVDFERLMKNKLMWILHI